MVSFLLDAGGLVALFLAFSVPAVIAARRNRRRYPDAERKFVLGAIGCGLVCAVLLAISDRLVDQCLAEGNTQCDDAGGIGPIVMIGVGFLAVSLFRTYLMVVD
ncbi:MAG: hypothetical protein AAGA93_20985 [Actinomycetota bacterium]